MLFSACFLHRRKSISDRVQMPRNFMEIFLDQKEHNGPWLRQGGAPRGHNPLGRARRPRRALVGCGHLGCPPDHLCNTPDVTFHICNSNSCHFRLCVMIFPSWSGFVFSFAFCSCHASHIMSSCASHLHSCSSHASEHFSPLSVSQSDTPTCTGAPLLSLFMCGC